MAHPPLLVVADKFPPAIGSTDAVAQFSSPSGKRRRWPALVGLLVVCFWVGNAGISLLIQHTALRTRLTARLASAFGRPVRVDHYDFSLWAGPALEAKSVRVEEDPRFGYEYFLRAESLRVQLRWQSLLRGHLELGTLSLTQPSLNIVRNANGEWNLAEWLPRPLIKATSDVTPYSPTGIASALRFRSIDVEGGRINFKWANEKLPFAFVGVAGTVDTDGPGRWRLDLEATPWRAPILTQQAGTIRVSGHMGGTSSRLLPVALNAAWADASVSDVLRLVRGDDYGIRGNLGLTVSADAHDSNWNVSGRAELRQLHRWDLALRPDNPSLNFLAQIKLDPAAAVMELTQVTVEAPHSNAHITGKMAWPVSLEEGPAEKNPPVPVSLSLRDSSVDLNDALAWIRAFHSGVSDDVSVHGLAEGKGSAWGWPPRVKEMEIDTSGAELVGQNGVGPIRLGATEFHYGPGQASLQPMTLSFGPRKVSANGASGGSIRVEAFFKDNPKGFASVLHVAGSLVQVRDLTAAAGALGANLSRGLDFAGPFRCDLRWQSSETQMPWTVQPVGFVELGAGPDDTGGASLRVPFMNQPVEGLKARADFKAGIRHIALSSAKALGAKWIGSFDRRGLDQGWQFSLSADRTTSADLDSWLNPRWRQSFFNRMLPFLNSRSVTNAIPENLRAEGHLRLDRFTLSPFVLNDFQGDVHVAGRHVQVSDARGKFYGGEVTGSLDAELNSIPSYRAVANFSRVDLSSITDTSSALVGMFSGLASGEVSFMARGATRADLVASLGCEGSAAVQPAELQNIDLLSSLQDLGFRQGISLFSQASGGFSCRNRKIEIRNLSLRGPKDDIDGGGSIDFSRTLDLQLTLRPASLESSEAADGNSIALESKRYRLTGTLSSPQVMTTPASPRRVR